MFECSIIHGYWAQADNWNTREVCNRMFKLKENVINIFTILYAHTPKLKTILNLYNIPFTVQ